MLLLSFIDSPIQFWIIGLNIAIVYAALQLILQFLPTGIKNRKELFGRLNIGLGLGFIYIFLYFVVKILIDQFHLTLSVLDAILYPLGAFAIFFVTFLIEPTFRKNRVFSVLAGINVVLFVFIDASTYLILLPIGWLGWSAAFMFSFVLFLHRNTGGFIRKRINLLLASALMFLLGWVGALNLVQSFFSADIIRVVFLALALAGLVGFYASFYRVNVFIESGWRGALEELYIIHGKLLQPLYYQNLMATEGKEGEKVSFFSGGLVGIDNLMKTIGTSQGSGATGVKLIEQQDKFLLVEHGFNVIVCFVANQNLDSLRYYLRQILAAWERYYASRPIDWAKAQQEIFGAMQGIVNRILQGGQI